LVEKNRLDTTTPYQSFLPLYRSTWTNSQSTSPSVCQYAKGGQWLYRHGTCKYSCGRD